MNAVPPNDPSADPPHKPGRWFQLSSVLLGGFFIWMAFRMSMPILAVAGVSEMMYAVVEQLPHRQARLRLAIIAAMLLANAAVFAWILLT